MIETTEPKTKQQLWKIELDELKKQKANKTLPAPVHKLIDDQIVKLEERVGRYDEYKGLLIRTNGQIERLSKKLTDLKKEQERFEEFLGVEASAPKVKPKLNLDEVVAFIKKNANSVTYGQLSSLTGFGRIKIKHLIEKNPLFKIDASVFPHRVVVK